MWIIDNTTYNAIINGEIALPCNITSPSFDDSVSLILWYRDDISTPIYTVDARQSLTLETAQHFLHQDIFQKRATFNITYPLAFLLIKNLRSSDDGDYRCRVDFRRARTINRILKLTVIVPTTSVIIYDKNFTIIDKIAGPFVEDSTQSLICDSSEGNPLPIVHWWHGKTLIDNDYFIINNTISRNVLTLKQLQLNRKNLNELIFTCQAYNTNLTVPITKTVQLDLYLKPQEIRIITPVNINSENGSINLVNSLNSTTTLLSSIQLSKNPIELACECIGSKPSCKIRWKKINKNFYNNKNFTNENILDNKIEYLNELSEIITNNGMTTISFLSYVPSIDDNDKYIVCIGYNPKITETKYSIQYSWLINITYSPILSLIMGSNSQQQDIVEGNNVYFECDIKANPYVTNFGWKLNGQQILNMLNTTTTISTTTTSTISTLINSVEMRNTSLLVTNVNHEHYGHYQCFASNNIGSGQSESVFLNVKYKPKCKHHTMIAIGIAIDETVEIECQVLANPINNLKYEWWIDLNNNDNQLDNNNISMKKSIKSIKLSIDNGTISTVKYRPKNLNDYGYLHCLAVNIIGKQQKPCIFHIIKAEPPSHPFNCSLINKTTNSLTVECTPGHSGGLNQTFFLEVYSINPTIRLLKNLTNNYRPYFNINNLPSGYIFKLVIYSTNRKGISKSIEITGSTTEPSPWKSDEYTSKHHHDLATTITPFLILIIIVIIIIVILIATLFIHIRKKFKGPNQNSNNNTTTDNQSQQQHYHYYHPQQYATTATTIIVKPKSIMKKKQKNWTTNNENNEDDVIKNSIINLIRKDDDVNGDDDDDDDGKNLKINLVNVIECLNVDEQQQQQNFIENQNFNQNENEMHTSISTISNFNNLNFNHYDHCQYQYQQHNHQLLTPTMTIVPYCNNANDVPLSTTTQLLNNNLNNFDEQLLNESKILPSTYEIDTKIKPITTTTTTTTMNE